MALVIDRLSTIDLYPASHDLVEGYVKEGPSSGCVSSNLAVFVFGLILGTLALAWHVCCALLQDMGAANSLGDTISR